MSKDEHGLLVDVPTGKEILSVYVEVKRNTSEQNNDSYLGITILCIKSGKVFSRKIEPLKDLIKIETLYEKLCNKDCFSVRYEVSVKELIIIDINNLIEVRVPLINPSDGDDKEVVWKNRTEVLSKNAKILSLQQEVEELRKRYDESIHKRVVFVEETDKYNPHLIYPSRPVTYRLYKTCHNFTLYSGASSWREFPGMHLEVEPPENKPISSGCSTVPLPTTAIRAMLICCLVSCKTKQEDLSICFDIDEKVFKSYATYLDTSEITKRSLSSQDECNNTSETKNRLGQELLDISSNNTLREYRHIYSFHNVVFISDRTVHTCKMRYKLKGPVSDPYKQTVVERVVDSIHFIASVFPV